MKRIARHRKVEAFLLELRSLRLAGGIMVGVYGAVGLFITTVAILGLAFGYREAPLVLPVGLACFVVAAFGVWVFRQARS